MSNSWKNLKDGRVTRMCIDHFLNKMQLLKLVDHQYDGTFDKDGTKSDGELNIKLPVQFTVSDGAAMDVQDIEQKSTLMTVATQKHVDFSWTSVERATSIEQAEHDIFEPAMSTLAQTVESTILADIYKDMYSLTGTPATDPAGVAAISNAGARLTDMLAPDGDRNLLVTPTSMAKISQSAYGYFHKDSEIINALIRNYIGTAAGANWFESTMIPNHTNGTRTDTTPVCNTSTGITSGTATITTTGFTATHTMKEGDIFTIDDVYAVNPITKARQAFLQQFVCTADITLDGTDAIAVSPTPYTSGQYQNVELVSAGASKALNNLDTGGSGAASGVYAQNMLFHKSAIAVAFAKLANPDSGTWDQRKIANVSLRIWKQSDIKSDTHDTRIDVLFGYLVVRPEWCIRVRG